MGSLGRLVIVAILLGVFHRFDTALALILAVNVVIKLYSPASRIRKSVLLIGMLITGVAGVATELWGISNGHWEYHDLPDGRTFPLWLSFAWMLSFYVLLRMEMLVISKLGLTSFAEKLAVVVALSAIVLTIGEMIAINLGVWTYTWGWQLFGVPVLAIVLLCLGHTTTFLLLNCYCRRFLAMDGLFEVSAELGSSESARAGV